MLKLYSKNGEDEFFVGLILISWASCFCITKMHKMSTSNWSLKQSIRKAETEKHYRRLMFHLEVFINLQNTTSVQISPQVRE